VCRPVAKEELPFARTVVQDLNDTLFHFRERHGVGRAIAAPQIGAFVRIVYMHVGTPVTFINPTLTDLSDEMMTLWDDCMSFPDLLVKVQRHRRCTIRFRDLEWNELEMKLEGATSELLQHEVDHLDGILALARALDSQSFAYRDQRES
jgi:peptide deformylase